MTPPDVGIVGGYVWEEKEVTIMPGVLSFPQIFLPQLTLCLVVISRNGRKRQDGSQLH